MTEALQETWLLARDKKREEGGWVYMNRQKKVKAVRKDREVSGAKGDKQTAIDLNDPPDEEDWRVIATFHTHDSNSAPSPRVPGFVWGDADVNNDQGVPGLILGNTFGGVGSVSDWTPYGPKRGFFGIGLPKRCEK